jgi:hypothetical protein
LVQGLLNRPLRFETQLCVYGLLPHVRLIDRVLLHLDWIGASVYPSSKWRVQSPGNHGIRRCGAYRSSDLEGRHHYRLCRTAAEPLVMTLT